jgi:DNA-binding SARP family transcriptional activator/pimeloyl-ACP methyl ester carboxylesterase
VLGPVVLQGATGEVAVTGAKARQILTALALSSPERVTLDRLIDGLWSEPPPSAAKIVQAHLSRLRCALAEAGAPDAISGGRAGYRLDVDGRIDTHELAQLVRRADAAKAGGDVRLAADLLGLARRQWRGESELPGTPWGEGLRRRLGEQRLELAIAHLGSLIEAGAAEAAVAELGELAAAEPLNERVWELRILALYRAGQATEALRAYQQVSSVLADEVGVAPGPALRTLEAAILAHDEVLAAPTATPTPVPGHLGDVGYALSGHTHVAYRSFGTGDTPVLLVNPGLLSVDGLLDEPHLAAGIGRLAGDRRRVVAFDPRAIGLSDRTQPPDTVTIDDWVLDALAVLDAARMDAVHLFAGGHGGLLALMLAARHPGRVRSLTLVNAFARFTRAEDYPHGIDAESFTAIQASFQSTAPGPRADILSLISPSVASDPAYREWWNATGRRAASPAAATALVAMMTRLDVRPVLPAIAGPCLVVIRHGCPLYDAGHGDYLAERLGGVTVQRQHDVNEPWWIGDTAGIIDAFEAFLGALPADRGG